FVILFRSGGKCPGTERARDWSGILFCRRQKRYKRKARFPALRAGNAPEFLKKTFVMLIAAGRGGDFFAPNEYNCNRGISERPGRVSGASPDLKITGRSLWAGLLFLKISALWMKT
ncbi:MAG: hypothetical protein LBL20_01620, partial [Treponema sp.]|nr:hypothetical protein [Treponema sp.]